jgi:hypothetical protein
VECFQFIEGCGVGQTGEGPTWHGAELRLYRKMRRRGRISPWKSVSAQTGGTDQAGHPARLLPNGGRICGASGFHFHEQEAWLAQNRTEIASKIEEGYAAAQRGELVEADAVRSRLADLKSTHSGKPRYS